MLLLQPEIANLLELESSTLTPCKKWKDYACLARKEGMKLIQPDKILLWMLSSFIALSIVSLALVANSISPEKILPSYIFALFAMIAPLLINIVQGARDIASKIGCKNLIKLTVRSSLYFAPFLLVVCFVIYTKEQVSESIQEEFYEIYLEKGNISVGKGQNTHINYNCRNAPDSAGFLCRSENNSFLISLKETNSHISKTFEAHILSAYEGKIAEIREKGTDTLTEAHKAIFGKEGALPPTFEKLTGISVPNSCNIFKAFFRSKHRRRCARKIFFGSMKDMYQENIKKLGKWSAEKLKQSAISFDEQASVIGNKLQSDTEASVQKYRETTNKYIDRLDTTNFLINCLLIVILILSLLKIFFYLFARVLYVGYREKIFVRFSQNKNIFISASDITNRPKDDNGYNMSPGFSIPVKKDEDWLLFSHKGIAPASIGDFIFALNQGRFFRRLFVGKICAQRFTSRETETLSVKSDILYRFIRVDIPPGGLVKVDISSVIACTENARFSLSFFPSLSALLLRRMIFSTISGPASIVIVAEGGVSEIIDGDNEEWIHPLNILAMDLCGKYNAKSNNAKHNIYIAPTLLAPGKDAKLVSHIFGHRSFSGVWFIRDLMLVIIPL